MGAQRRGVEVHCSYRDERFHIHLPVTLAPIIGGTCRRRPKVLELRRAARKCRIVVDIRRRIAIVPAEGADELR
jgi:hypothetical protein